MPEAHGGGSLSGHPRQTPSSWPRRWAGSSAPGPFLPVNVVGAALARDGSDQQQAELLPGLLAGETIATWAFAERRRHVGRRRGVAHRERSTATRSCSRGAKAYVEAAGVADHVPRDRAAPATGSPR